ncbi:hypothetical protein AWY79_13400 [Pseudodesulfovibrio indicus]|uniref:Uncharacterized protein n=1 Tax=Pseudodesulfovibrio indicus TaxID=1716143 RepID=A0ABM5YXG1_9BACT|nr:hypothetical protein AWY79_13400 [Pseudodesulfovibrio indicus]
MLISMMKMFYAILVELYSLEIFVLCLSVISHGFLLKMHIFWVLSVCMGVHLKVMLIFQMHCFLKRLISKNPRSTGQLILLVRSFLIMLSLREQQCMVMQTL